jgi:hypothetical protein
MAVEFAENRRVPTAADDSYEADRPWEQQVSPNTTLFCASLRKETDLWNKHSQLPPFGLDSLSSPLF